MFPEEIISARMVHALEILFDAHHPDRGSIDSILNHPDRDDVRQSPSHNCFSLPGRTKNVCWRACSVYDMMLCHLFRAVVYHFRAILKMGNQHRQRFYGGDLHMFTKLSPGGDIYRRVDLVISLSTYQQDRADSSDEEDEDDEEEDEEERRRRKKEGRKNGYG